MWVLFSSACPADGASTLGLVSSAHIALDMAPLRPPLTLGYVSLHLDAAVLLCFFPSVEMLPLLVFPMFGVPHHVFDGAHRTWLWLTDKEHVTGTLKNHCFPFCHKQKLLAEELHRLDSPCVLYGHGGGETLVMHANVEVGADLAVALAKINELGS